MRVSKAKPLNCKWRMGFFKTLNRLNLKIDSVRASGFDLNPGDSVLEPIKLVMIAESVSGVDLTLNDKGIITDILTNDGTRIMFKVDGNNIYAPSMLAHHFYSTMPKALFLDNMLGYCAIMDQPPSLSMLDAIENDDEFIVMPNIPRWIINPVLKLLRRNASLTRRMEDLVLEYQWIEQFPLAIRAVAFDYTLDELESYIEHNKTLNASVRTGVENFIGEIKHAKKF